MAGNLSGEELSQYMECFKQFDTNSDGTINNEELGNLLRLLGNNPSEEDLKKMVDILDTNRDGTIDFTEFIAMMAPKSRDSTKDPERGLKAIFKNHDYDKSGLMSTEDLRKILQTFGNCVTKEEIETIIVETDNNNDGKINFTEFETALNRMAEEQTKGHGDSR